MFNGQNCKINMYKGINSIKSRREVFQRVSSAREFLKNRNTSLGSCLKKKAHQQVHFKVYHDHQRVKLASKTSWIKSLAMIFKNLLGVRRFAMSAVKKPEVIFILGGPGSGKGTLCSQLVEKTGYVHLSAGDLLREERAKPGSKFGEIIEGHIRNGTIVPVEITCSLLDQAMQQSANPDKRFLIDGFPRNQDNLDGWTRTMSEKTVVKGVVNLECSEKVCTERCLNRGLKGSGRSDDNAESLAKRHKTFVNDTMPIIKYYQERGVTFSFNSMQAKKKVLADVCEKLREIGWMKD